MPRTVSNFALGLWSPCLSHLRSLSGALLGGGFLLLKLIPLPRLVEKLNRARIRCVCNLLLRKPDPLLSVGDYLPALRLANVLILPRRNTVEHVGSLHLEMLAKLLLLFARLLRRDALLFGLNLLLVFLLLVPLGLVQEQVALGHSLG